MTMVKEMTPAQFKARAETGGEQVLLDVREAWELAIARVAEAVHIPMGEVPARLTELDRDRDIVVLCRSGGRSAQVAGFLEQQGFENVWNLTGGILAWSDQLDSSIPHY